jgi:hypothetical protein
MIQKLLVLAIVPIAMLACRGNEKKAPETDTDVATTFIRDILDNRINEAEQFILKDTANMQYFDIIRQQYSRKDKAELEKYKAADIIINEISNVTDSISIVNYSNSYDKASKNKVKVVRVNGKWLIDLKYTFSGNM